MTYTRPDTPAIMSPPSGKNSTVSVFVTSGIGRTIASASLPSRTDTLRVALGGAPDFATSNRSDGSRNRTSRTVRAPPASVTDANFAPVCVWIVFPSIVATTSAVASGIGPPAVRDTSTRACTYSPAP